MEIGRTENRGAVHRGGGTDAASGGGAVLFFVSRERDGARSADGRPREMRPWRKARMSGAFQISTPRGRRRGRREMRKLRVAMITLVTYVHIDHIRGVQRFARLKHAWWILRKRTLRNLWILPTGNCRPALTDREVGFFLSPPFMVPLAPLPDKPLPERPFAPLPDMVEVFGCVGGGGRVKRGWM